MLPWQHATTHKVGGSKILIILIEMAANYFGDTAKTDTKKVCTTQNSMNQLSVLHRSKKMRDDLLSDGMHQLTAHFMYIHPGLCL